MPKLSGRQGHSEFKCGHVAREQEETIIRKGRECFQRKSSIPGTQKTVKTFPVDIPKTIQYEGQCRTAEKIYCFNRNNQHIKMNSLKQT